MAEINTDRQTQEMLDFLRTKIRYDPDTGHLHNVCSRRAGGVGAITGNHRVSKTTGKPMHVMVAVTYKGKLHSLAAHRVAWALHYGEWPTLTIDHINGVCDDNRISNLQEMTHSDNVRKMLKTRGRSPETTAKIVAKTTGKKRSEEFRAQRSELNRQRVVTPETRAKTSAIMKEWHRKRKSISNGSVASEQE